MGLTRFFLRLPVPDARVALHLLSTRRWGCHRCQATLCGWLGAYLLPLVGGSCGQKKKGKCYKSENQGLISAARGIEPLIRLQYPVLYLSRLQRIYLRTFDTLIRVAARRMFPAAPHWDSGGRTG